MNPLMLALKNGEKAQAVAEVQHLLARGEAAKKIITHYIEPTMDSLSEKCTAENFNLLEVMLAGRAVVSVMQELFPPGSVPPPTRETILLATLEGDVHDLGKNILKTILVINGYRVIDCGKDCPLEKLVQTARQEQPFAIGISGLITSVIPQVKRMKSMLVENSLEQVLVFVGGAALKQASADDLQVDFVAENAFEGEAFLKACLVEK